MKWTDYLYNVFFPNRCPGCDVMLYPEELICEPCGERMLIAHDAVCHICGQASCVCKRRTFSFDRAVVACRYEDEAKSAIVRLKNSSNTNFAYFSARILAERIRYSLNYGTFDYVMPVPMHPANERKRGYNQAALIAKEIAGLLEIPYREDVLYKGKSKYAQHELRAQVRRQNVSSFGIHDISLEGMKILLCDDVLTTGSTLDCCAGLLKQNGAERVTIAAATVTVRKGMHTSVQDTKEEP